MTDLSRKHLVSELNDVLRRNEPHLSSAGPVSTATAQARHEMAYTLKTDIENGVYDIPGASARAFYIETLATRWALLTPRERNRLYRIDSLLAISISHLAEGVSYSEEEPLSTPKVASSPWRRPTIIWLGLIGITLVGVQLAFNFLA